MRCSICARPRVASTTPLCYIYRNPIFVLVPCRILFYFVSFLTVAFSFPAFWTCRRSRLSSPPPPGYTCLRFYRAGDSLSILYTARRFSPTFADSRTRACRDEKKAQDPSVVDPSAVDPSVVDPSAICIFVDPSVPPLLCLLTRPLSAHVRCCCRSRLFLPAPSPHASPLDPFRATVMSIHNSNDLAFESVNDAIASLGLHKEDVLSSTLFDLVEEGDVDAVRQSVEDLMARHGAAGSGGGGRRGVPSCCLP